MALRDQPYLPLYIQDFLTDEKLAECSAQSTGVYIRIMCLMHKSEQYGKILLKLKHKQSDKQILNFALLLAKHFPYDVDVIHSSLIELIEEGVLIVEGDFLIQKRMVKDFNISIKRSESGREGGKNSLGKNKNFAQAKSQANSENENEYVNDIEFIPKEGVQGESFEVVDFEFYPFDEFWNDYEKKVGEKGKLEKKWSKVSIEDRKAIKEYVPKYKKAQPEKKFRKNPETFLNNKSWHDELIPTTAIQVTRQQRGVSMSDTQAIFNELTGKK